MRRTVVVDTNVLVVANHRAGHAFPACVIQTIRALLLVKESGRIALDDQYRIFDEYRRHCSFAGQPGVGDAFFRWVHDHQANPALCERVRIHPRGDDIDDFLEFPDDPELARFDRSDRKFVAVARASVNNPVVLNAVDSDWRDHRTALERNGVFVEFLCPEQFHPPAPTIP